LVTIQEAVLSAQKEYLRVSGITGISYSGNTIVFYVETSSIPVPSSYMGYPVLFVVTGKFGVL